MVDLAQLQEASADWEAMDRGGHRLARHLSFTCFGLAVVAGITAALIPSATTVAAMATGLLLMASVFCLRVWWGPSPLPYSELEPPATVAFTAEENRWFMASQAPEPFSAISACPSCGDLTVHPARRPSESDPSWAAIIRHCAVCQREWAQAQ
ncbi:hypothetical protein MNVI_14490 [Mycobacterium noviomagense]|nr:hypothetical protein MNVI_14490 [Mycobacterium noviomagense]